MINDFPGLFTANKLVCYSVPVPTITTWGQDAQMRKFLNSNPTSALDGLSLRGWCILPCETCNIVLLSGRLFNSCAEVKPSNKGFSLLFTTVVGPYGPLPRWERTTVLSTDPVEPDEYTYDVCELMTLFAAQMLDPTQPLAIEEMYGLRRREGSKKDLRVLRGTKH